MSRIALLFLLLSALSWAKDRKWQDAEVFAIQEKDVESSEQLYKSATVNNQSNAPLRDAGVEKHKSKLYIYDFKAGDKHILGSISKKRIEGLSEHAAVKVIVERGWVIVQLPDNKEKRLDFVDTK